MIANGILTQDLGNKPQFDTSMNGKTSKKKGKSTTSKEDSTPHQSNGKSKKQKQIKEANITTMEDIREDN